MAEIERTRMALLPRAAVAALYLAVLALGVCSAFRPMLTSGLRRLQTDPGDTLLNHYVLEHSWRWLTQSGYAGTLWSAPFFYPEPLTLAYSENLLGTAPLYWALRLVAEPCTAYGLWMILVGAATFAATAWALRRFGLAHPLAAFGAFVFAFGLPRVAQLGHQQLLPHLFAPLAVLACWRWLAQPRLSVLAGLLAACYLQMLSSIYLGWFLHLGLAVFATAYLLGHPGSWPALAAFVRRRGLAAGGLLVGVGLLYVWLLAPYRQANLGFARRWDECVPFLTTAADWVLPPQNSLHRVCLGISSAVNEGERWVFPGWSVLALAGGAVALLAFRSRILTAERARLTAALLGTALFLAVLSLADLPGGSLWWWVHQYVPGAGAVRAVARINLTGLLFALTGALLALDAVVRAAGERRVLCHVLAALLLLTATIEQVPAVLPSFEAAPFHARAQTIARQLSRGTAGYVAGNAGEPMWTSELLAMWAGLYANRPVVNGYSGREPPGYPDTVNLPPEQVFDWLSGPAATGPRWSGRLAYVVLQRASGEYRSVVLEVEGDRLLVRR